MLISKLFNYSRKKIYTKFNIFEEIRSVDKIVLTFQFLFAVSATVLIGVVILLNLAPFGVVKTYSLFAEKDPLVLGPKERVKEIQSSKSFLLLADSIYLATKMPQKFEKALVRITYKNPYKDQIIEAGFKDDAIWHYESKLIDVPFFNSLSWPYIGDDLILFQRDKKYTTVDEFLANPPEQSIIGTYNYDFSQVSAFITKLPNYSPKRETTIISTPLRGSHTMYVYVQNERFKMKFIKEDLNWYSGEDKMHVQVFKENDMVYEQSLPDDGVTSNDRARGASQTLEIENPGTDFPESGVYKVVINTSNDVVIKSIATNLHKIVFEGSIFPVAGNSLYENYQTATPTQVFSNALAYSAITYHQQGIQNIKIDDELFAVDSIQDDSVYIPKKDFNSMFIPKGDIILTGILGYFSFSEDSFFRPTKYRIMPITTPTDIEIVDYILTPYVPPKKDGVYSTATQEFDLKKAYLEEKKLSWIIRLPGLEKNNRKIEIKDMQIQLVKKPSVKL